MTVTPRTITSTTATHGRTLVSTGQANQTAPSIAPDLATSPPVTCDSTGIPGQRNNARPPTTRTMAMTPNAGRSEDRLTGSPGGLNRRWLAAVPDRHGRSPGCRRGWRRTNGAIGSWSGRRTARRTHRCGKPSFAPNCRRQTAVARTASTVPSAPSSPSPRGARTGCPSGLTRNPMGASRASRASGDNIA